MKISNPFPKITRYLGISKSDAKFVLAFFVFTFSLSMIILGALNYFQEKGYQDGYCAALNGVYLGNNACDAQGKVVYIP